MLGDRSSMIRWMDGIRAGTGMSGRRWMVVWCVVIGEIRGRHGCVEETEYMKPNFIRINKNGIDNM